MRSLRPLVSLTVITILATLVAACTTTEQSPINPFPARPANLSIESVDPCSMLDSEQSRELNLRAPTQRTYPVEGRPSPGCTWITDTDLGYNVQKIPIGAEAATGDPAGAVITVNGFGAVRRSVSVIPDENAICQITVDASPGNSIRVQVQSTPGGSRRSDEEMCRLATDVASKVMTTVVATASK